MIDLLPFGEKARLSIFEADFLNVWEGSVRSMKTITSLFGWMLYVIQSAGRTFVMAGNTLGSLSRNCIDGEFGLLSLSGGTMRKTRDADGSTVIRISDKTIYLFGADDIRAYRKLRGLSPTGIYNDEVNLQHKDFVVECFNRTIASKERRHYWTLNPEAPSHWIYKDYIDKYRDEKLPGYKYWHFNMDDNPALTEERKAELKTQYSGLFYRRFILGERVRAEGSCYPSFGAHCVIDQMPEDWRIMFVQIGFDIGGNKSATSLTATGFVRIPGQSRLAIVVLRELYDTENKSTESVLANYKDFVLKVKAQWQCADCYIDSAEQLILKSARNLGMLNVHNSLKRPIVDRVRFVDVMMSQGRLFILKQCKHTIEAIESAVWDEKSAKETRLDDGTTNIDSIDSLDYSIESRMAEVL